jgi:hypothetical protein
VGRSGRPGSTARLELMFGNVVRLPSSASCLVSGGCSVEASVICRRSFDSCSWGMVETRGAPGWRWRGIPFVACRSVCLSAGLPAGLSALCVSRPLASRCGGVSAPWPCRDRDRRRRHRRHRRCGRGGAARVHSSHAPGPLRSRGSRSCTSRAEYCWWASCLRTLRTS